MKSKLNTKPRRMPKQSRSRALVDEIVYAAAQVLIEDGYDKATTNKIAERAGVSVGSLYQYFPNKESLILELNLRLGTTEFEIIQNKFQSIRNAPLNVAITEIVKAMVALHAYEPALHKVLVEQVPRIGDLKKINEIDGRIVELMREHLQQHFEKFAEDKMDLILFIIFNVVESLTHQAVLYRPEFLEDELLADEICFLVENFLKRHLEVERPD